MNTDWKSFLLSQQACVDADNSVSFPSAEKVTRNSVHPLTQFSVLTISGKDAIKLLQGQVTCNVNDIGESKSSLAAMCNPKGRVIATFLLVKNGESFLMILPAELLETVKKRLQMYVLRSEVTITDSTNDYCLIGISEPVKASQPFVTETQQNIIAVNFPASTARKLFIADVDNAIRFWSEKIDFQGFRKAGSGEWRYLDIISGIPWLTTATSEEFIPQMLNLDKLGGISFTKGCYTGQEIVARTHYLGKAKREMFLAECQSSPPPEPNSAIVNDEEAVGKVLLAQQDEHNCKMLVILQVTDPAATNLRLKDYTQPQINLLPFST